ncbi:hypothetical protein BKI52_22905 [marine bacterium AO1-C]|nr:hypothetical protein BKI52_22905 [marine bacterium AO1-C]
MAQTNWTGGAGDNDWNNAGNWSAGIPTATSNVTILNVASLPILVSAETINDLTINASASLTVNAGGSLTLSGNFTNNGTFTASSTGAVVFNGTTNASISGTGTTTFQTLTNSKTGSATLSIDKAITTEGAATVSSGATLILSAGITWNLNGNLVNQGTVTANNIGSTIVVGGATQTEISNNDFSVYNLTVSKTASSPATNNDARVRLRSGMALTVDNNLQLNTGRIVGSGGNNLIILEASATTSDPNANSFVEGRVRKIKGTITDFVFPIGRNGRFGRLAVVNLTGGSATDHFTAEYFGTSANNSIVDATIDDVSNREYWRLLRSGSTTCNVRLYWEDGTVSGINGPSTTVNLTDLRVAQLNATTSEWTSRGNTATTGTVATTGTIDSDAGQGSNISNNDIWTLGYDDPGGTNGNQDWNIVTWVGATSTDWHTASNWSPASVPVSTDEVVIIGDRPNDPIIASNAQISTLLLSPNTSPGVTPTNLPTLTINASQTLTVGNDNTDGTLDNSGTITNNGILTTTGQFDNNDNGVIDNNLGASITACTANTGSFRNGVGSDDTPVINNSGTITVEEEQRFDNSRGGTINNQSTGLIVSTGHFRNRSQSPTTASIANDGTIQLLRDFQNNRPLTGSGTLEFTTGTRNRDSNITGSTTFSQQIVISKTNNRTTIFQIDVTATNNVTIPSTSGVQINTGTNLTIEGNLTNNGVFTAQTGSTVTLSGSGQDSQLSGSFTGTNAFDNLVSAKSGGFTTQVLSNIEVNGNLTISTGTFAVNGSNALTLEGSFSNEATFTANNSQVTFASTTDVTIGGAATTTFYDITFNSTATNGITLNAPVNVSNSATFTAGFVNTTTTNLLTINNGATSTEGNATSYVRGPIRKIGMTSGGNFVFPVGKSDKWARLELLDFDATSTTDHFTVEYFDTRPPNSNILQVESPLNDISWQEYWNVDRGNTGGGGGSVGARVKLYWEDNLFSRIDNPATSDLRVVHYNSGVGKWQDQGQLNLTQASSTGTVTTVSVQTSFSPWTFGSLSSTINGLPVTLLNFEGKSGNEQNILQWQTIDESNISHFEVQKSTNGIDFETFTQVQALNRKQELSQYQVVDNTVTQAFTIYYRLKIVEPGQPDVFSKVVALQNPQVSIEALAYPNPFTESIHLKFLAQQNDHCQLHCYDVLGKLIRQKSFTINTTGPQHYALATNDLKPGTYLLHFKSPYGLKKFTLVK